MADTSSPRPGAIGTAHIRLEVVTDTADGLRAAVLGGAERIELVSALGTGGVTPSPGLMQLAAGCGVPVRAMIRPRGGDFTYSAADLDLMRRDIDAATACGLAGVVFGANRPTGELDGTALICLVEQAHALGLETAIHRSFDLAPDPLAAIETCISLGLSTILTSGGPRHAAAGIDGLARYVTAADGRIEIMAGSGVTADNASAIVKGAGVAWVHASCSATLTAAEQPPVERVAALGGLTAARNDTDLTSVQRLRGVLDALETVPGKEHA